MLYAVDLAEALPAEWSDDDDDSDNDDGDAGAPGPDRQRARPRRLVDRRAREEASALLYLEEVLAAEDYLTPTSTPLQLDGLRIVDFIFTNITMFDL
jgi:hypothetical protein